MNREEKLFEEAMDRVDVRFVEEPLKQKDEKKVLTMKRKAAGAKTGWILAVAALFICLIAGGIIFARTGIFRPENGTDPTEAADTYAPTGGNYDPTGNENGEKKVPFTFLYYHGMAWIPEDLYETLPEGFSETDTIRKNNDYHVPQEELAACGLREGLKVFTSEKDEKVVIIQREDGKFLLFLPYDGQIMNFEPEYDQPEDFPAGEVARRFLSYRGELWTNYGVFETLPESYLQEPYGGYLSILKNDNWKLPDTSMDLCSTQLKEGTKVYFSKLDPDVLYVEREEGGYYRFLPYRADASGWVPRP